MEAVLHCVCVLFVAKTRHSSAGTRDGFPKKRELGRDFANICVGPLRMSFFFCRSVLVVFGNGSLWCLWIAWLGQCPGLRVRLRVLAPRFARTLCFLPNCCWTSFGVISGLHNECGALGFLALADQTIKTIRMRAWISYPFAAISLCLSYDSLTLFPIISHDFTLIYMRPGYGMWPAVDIHINMNIG